MTTSLLERWPALGRLSAGLTAGRWAATFFAVALGQFVFWVALLHLLIGEREQVERLMYFIGFTVLPLVSILITFGGAWLVQRSGRDLAAFSDGLMAFNLGLGLVAGLLARGEFFTAQPSFLVLERLLSLEGAQHLGLAELAQTQAQRSEALALAVLALALGGQGGVLLAALRLSAQQARRAFLGLLWGMSGLLLLLGGPAAADFAALAARSGPEVRVAQAGWPDIVLGWEIDAEGCLAYRFSGEGAQAVWLGEQGLAHVEAVNLGQSCQALPLLVRVIDAGGQEALFLAGMPPFSALTAWPLALLAGLLGPLLLLWGGGACRVGLALLGLGVLFGASFAATGPEAWAILLGALLLALLLGRLPWRGGRWFDAAFLSLITALCINLGFSYDQFHYHSGWMATINAMLHGQAFMVDVFSQRGFLSMVTLTGIFAVVPLHYASFALLIGLAITTQFAALYGLLRGAGVGRWWAVLAVLAGIALYLYFNSLGGQRLPGFSPLRLGYSFVLALAVAWRVRQPRRGRWTLELGLVAAGVLWSIDNAAIVAVSYLALIIYEALAQHGLSLAGLAWGLKRAGLALLVVLLAFGLANAWVWLSSGQVARWDIYWGFFGFHEGHENYSLPVDFWGEGWWLILGAHLMGLMLLAWRLIQRQRGPMQLGEAVALLLMVGGVLQTYHYITQSVAVYNHAIPAMASLAFIFSSLAQPWHGVARVLGLAGVLALAGLAIPLNAEVWPDNPPLGLALLRIVGEGVQGQTEALTAIGQRWGGYREGDYLQAPLNRWQPARAAHIAEAADLIRRYSPQETRLNVFMGPNSTLHTLLIVQATHRYPITISIHDTRVPALVEQILAADVAQQVGDMLYVKAQDIEGRDEVQPLMPVLLDRLCRQFDFELVEASEHGVLALRLQPSTGENAVCEEQGLFLPPHP